MIERSDKIKRFDPRQCPECGTKSITHLNKHIKGWAEYSTTARKDVLVLETIKGFIPTLIYEIRYLCPECHTCLFVTDEEALKFLKGRYVGMYAGADHPDGQYYIFKDI